MLRRQQTVVLNLTPGHKKKKPAKESEKHTAGDSGFNEQLLPKEREPSGSSSHKKSSHPVLSRGALSPPAKCTKQQATTTADKGSSSTVADKGKKKEISSTKGKAQLNPSLIPVGAEGVSFCLKV